jgi:hypothetical protein
MKNAAAQLISAIFHPLLILTYGLITLLLFNPFAFGANSISDRVPLIMLCLAYTFFLPFISIVFMAMMGMVDSLQLHKREERIGPLIICIVFYTWFFLNIHRNADTPPIFSVFILGSVVALGLAFFISVFSKVSLHMTGLGGLLGILAIMFWHFGYVQVSIPGYHIHIRTIFIIGILLSGLVASVRLWLGAHIPKDVYGGILIGISSQFIALRFLL